ncbi:tRNA (adenosine(37)-N6)-threonylcarbamoyltransferase complex dimerization subunit type 1 TsaB [Pseudoteredinibacter isoporae]|uniref:tRNA threonylcarbamoyladenosine biosynthesis protein TsaB n=1 Tax=Pseudoteredinibacter isoporae TaxID=570281 RepID=A0A7X0MXH0_9GAMM|nr:tRNA (adenosine(37)-N6)-threonylcarbamoyltransferase complex dimerization subunit type 1 TsaB [Pseudoteredinibacter isoporae]MBB6523726.1 tRNA threonylcarbamoyladenosine biosynthesis protein TsaB [Pseudoteredinibacter isoporae]NHO89228.1 tRNA (adenosine(37)-N6)-threonylcarbamoyltransferase complex dimerization subunit type 1 TsaB [Pseudoteredinibacter isoporae]NIB22161.1 tRNA (adenosine(37)-N6)-threonylcarbamoyltransferase complex dimerization subunit type 1 TsaB [Pseudoteredinibacter isopora
MSYILSLDTASDYCSVAIVDTRQQTSLAELDIRELRRQAPRQHTQLLLPMVDELLQQEAVDRHELNAIAFGAGPGSFTGLRISFAVVQGLAYGLQIPVLPISTLAAMGSAMAQSNLPDINAQAEKKSVFLSCLDARMNQVYWGAYSHDGEKLLALQDDALDNPDIAAEKMQQLIESQFPKTTVYCCGPGWQYPELSEILNRAGQKDLDIEPWAQEILRLGFDQWQSGNVQDIRQVQPVYLRNEVSWEKRQRIRQP